MAIETAFALMTIWLVAGLFSMSVAIALAHVKHRVWVFWGIVCFLVPPLVVILLLLPRRAGPAPYEAESEPWFDNQGGDKIGRPR